LALHFIRLGSFFCHVHSFPQAADDYYHLWISNCTTTTVSGSLTSPQPANIILRKF
jgi:hypothetical protein